MAFSSGFFNGINGDRLYDAEDFSNFLGGLVTDGCLPNDVGLKVIEHSEAIGSNPPSVIIYPGWAYIKGRWAYNDAPLIYTLGEAQQIIPNQYHLIYLCLDTNEDGSRAITIEHITGANPIMPADAAGKYYSPLAKVADQMDSQPLQAHIIDYREYAGVSGVGINTPSLVDKCVTHAKLDDDAVGINNIIDKSVDITKMVDESTTSLTVSSSYDPVLNDGATRYSNPTGDYVSKNGELLAVMFSAQAVTGGTSRRLTYFLQHSTDGGNTWTTVPGTSGISACPSDNSTYRFPGTAFIKTTTGETNRFRVGITAMSGSFERSVLAVHSVHAFM